MDRLLKRSILWLVPGFLWLNPLSATDFEAGRHTVVSAVDFSLVYASSPLDSWLKGGVGKLRFDENNNGLKLSRFFLDYTGRLTDTLNARLTVDVNDDLKSQVDFTEAYLDFRPIPKSAYRTRWRVGAFYPRISLENVGPGWSTPYTLSSSAINTWVAEELRTVGVEFSVTRSPQASASLHQFTFEGAVFFANDPAGSLLAWKGWSVHDRQTGLRGRLPLPPLPVIEPGEEAAAQAPWVEPFHEIDNRPGYYVNTEWRYGTRSRLRFFHYDNRGDPEALSDGQYAWATSFDQIGWQIMLPGDVGLITQWMQGETAMGPVTGSTNLVDTIFESTFVLLTRKFGSRRISLRYDDFELNELDSTADDNNDDYGHAWTVAYLHQISPQLRIGAEYMEINTHHCGWQYYGLPTQARERVTQLTLRWQFGS